MREFQGFLIDSEISQKISDFLLKLPKKWDFRPKIADFPGNWNFTICSEKSTFGLGLKKEFPEKCTFCRKMKDFWKSQEIWPIGQISASFRLFFSQNPGKSIDFPGFLWPIILSKIYDF